MVLLMVSTPPPGVVRRKDLLGEGKRAVGRRDLTCMSTSGFPAAPLPNSAIIITHWKRV